MNFLKKILGYKTEDSPLSSEDEIFAFECEAQLIGYPNGDKQEL